MDQLKDLFERYRYSEKKWHIIIPIIIGVLVPTYFFYTKNPVVQESLMTLKGEHTTSKERFEQALNQSQNVAELEKRRIEAESLKKEILQTAPESFNVDSILRKIHEIAVNNEVRISTFSPGEGSEVVAVATPAPNPAEGGAEQTVKAGYQESLVKIEANGNFTRMAKFMDDLLHNKQMFHIRNVSLSRVGSGTLSDDATDVTKVLARANIEVDTKFDLVVYTSN